MRNPILACERRGNLLEITGFGRPFGITQEADGCWLIADMDMHMVIRIDPSFFEYQCLYRLDEGWSSWIKMASSSIQKKGKFAPADFNGPHATAISETQDIIVTCYYRPDLVVINSITGERAKLTNQIALNFSTCVDSLEGPASACYDPVTQGLLITEYKQNTVILMAKNAQILGCIGGGNIFLYNQQTHFFADGKIGFLDRPHMCIRDPENNLLVADTWNHRIHKFSALGEPMEVIYSYDEGWVEMPKTTQKIQNPSQLSQLTQEKIAAPVSLSLIDNDRLLIVSWGHQALFILNLKTGRLIHKIDTLNLQCPYDAKYSDKTLIVANSHAGRLQVLLNT